MYFPLRLKELEKKVKFWGKKINLYCTPLTDLKILWNFAAICSGLQDQFAKPFTKGEGS